MKRLVYLAFLCALAVALPIRAQTTSFSLSTTNATTYIPSPCPPVNRSISVEWSNIETARGTYTWSGLASWITETAACAGAVNHYTFSHVPNWANGSGGTAVPPSDINTSATCQAPIAGVVTTDCQYKEFVTSLMQYVCNVGSQPGTPLPVSSCNNFVYFEMWNEFNTSGYWTGTATQLAQMSLDAAAIIRTYCSGCYVVGGSVSAGGVGGGGSISGDYDVALLAYLTAWGGLSGFVKPDYVSIHPYPSRDNVFPAPFPTTLVSNSNSVCTSGNTPNSSCYVAVYQEISQVKGTAVLQNAAISAWAAGTPVIGSEGGFGVMRAVAGGNTSYAATSFSITSNVATVTGTNNFTSGETIILDGWTTATYFNEVTVTVLSTGLSSSQYEFNFTHANVSSTSDTGQANDLTNTTFLRAAYISQWMMTLWAQGTAVQLLYAGYDNTCTWGVYWECPNNSSPGWHTAFTQTQTWVNESTLTGTWTSTAVSGGNVWALSVNVGGNAAQIAFFDGWLTSYTKSTSFSTVQNLAGTTSSTGGGVTLNQQPVLLTTNPTVNAPNPPLLVGAKVVIHTGGAS